MFDLLLAGGQVYDGSGAPARPADIGIEAGRIITVGDLASAQAARRVELNGLAVSPGFIDTHAHSDLAYLSADDTSDIAASAVRQGVTTQITGNCGFSPFPATVTELDPQEPYRILFPPEVESYFPTLAAYRTRCAGARLPVNIAPLVGHGRVRAAVMKGAPRAARLADRELMARLTDEALSDGSFGVSTGLAYSPGCHADMGELVAVCHALARRGLPYVSHIRDEGDHVVSAVSEALMVGKATETAVHISHHKLAGARNWGRTSATLGLIEKARAEGVAVTLDVYPYTAGSTLLADLLPPWALAGSPSEMRQRLLDRSAVDTLAANFEEGLPGWQNLVSLCGWQNIALAGEGWPERPSIAEVASSRGRREVQVMADVLLEDPGMFVIIEMMDQRDVDIISDLRYAMIGSDGIPVRGGEHPRLSGSFARALARRSHDQRQLAELISRMTSLPAETFRIPDRGLIAPGRIADLVVFDPASVRDQATYAEPTRHPLGITHVFLGGQAVVDDGRLTGERPGLVLEPTA